MTGFLFSISSNVNIVFCTVSGPSIIFLSEIETIQERSEGISNVAFETLIINCQIYFINFFDFNCLMSNFCFLEKIYLSKIKRTFVMKACS